MAHATFKEDITQLSILQSWVLSKIMPIPLPWKVKIVVKVSLKVLSCYAAQTHAFPEIIILLGDYEERYALFVFDNS